jgi:hypothetical protein
VKQTYRVHRSGDPVLEDGWRHRRSPVTQLLRSPLFPLLVRIPGTPKMDRLLLAGRMLPQQHTKADVEWLGESD